MYYKYAQQVSTNMAKRAHKKATLKAKLKELNIKEILDAALCVWLNEPKSDEYTAVVSKYGAGLREDEIDEVVHSILVEMYECAEF